MSLVAHAETELRRAGLFDADADYGGAIGDSVLRIVREFAAEGHSGGSAGLSLGILERLLRYQPLGPLTNDPAEWVDVSEYSGEPMWQSRRKPSAFSRDGGRTHYDLDEPQPRWRQVLARMRLVPRFRLHVTASPET